MDNWIQRKPPTQHIPHIRRDRAARPDHSNHLVDTLAWVGNEYQTNPIFAENETRETEIAARARGVNLVLVNVSHESEFEAAFSNLVQQKIGGLLVSADGYFLSHREKLISLAARHALPAVWGWPAPGGLISYTTDFLDAWRRAGVYAGRILKGEKPANMPVEQVTKVDLTR